MGMQWEGSFMVDNDMFTWKKEARFRAQVFANCGNAIVTNGKGCNVCKKHQHMDNNRI